MPTIRSKNPEAVRGQKHDETCGKRSTVFLVQLHPRTLSLDGDNFQESDGSTYNISQDAHKANHT